MNIQYFIKNKKGLLFLLGILFGCFSLATSTGIKNLGDGYYISENKLGYHESIDFCRNNDAEILNIMSYKDFFTYATKLNETPEYLGIDIWTGEFMSDKENIEDEPYIGLSVYNIDDMFFYNITNYNVPTEQLNCVCFKKSDLDVIISETISQTQTITNTQTLSDYTSVIETETSTNTFVTVTQSQVLGSVMIFSSSVIDTPIMNLTETILIEEEQTTIYEHTVTDKYISKVYSFFPFSFTVTDEKTIVSTPEVLFSSIIPITKTVTNVTLYKTPLTFIETIMNTSSITETSLISISKTVTEISRAYVSDVSITIPFDLTITKPEASTCMPIYPETESFITNNFVSIYNINEYAYFKPKKHNLDDDLTELSTHHKKECECCECNCKANGVIRQQKEYNDCGCFAESNKDPIEQTQELIYHKHDSKPKECSFEQKQKAIECGCNYESNNCFNFAYNLESNKNKLKNYLKETISCKFEEKDNEIEIKDPDDTEDQDDQSSFSTEKTNSESKTTLSPEYSTTTSAEAIESKSILAEISFLISILCLTLFL